MPSRDIMRHRKIMLTCFFARAQCPWCGHYPINHLTSSDHPVSSSHFIGSGYYHLVRYLRWYSCWRTFSLHFLVRLYTMNPDFGGLFDHSGHFNQIMFCHDTWSNGDIYKRTWFLFQHSVILFKLQSLLCPRSSWEWWFCRFLLGLGTRAIGHLDIKMVQTMNLKGRIGMKPRTFSRWDLWRCSRWCRPDRLVHLHTHTRWPLNYTRVVGGEERLHLNGNRHEAS